MFKKQKYLLFFYYIRPKRKMKETYKNIPLLKYDALNINMSIFYVYEMVC